jgi:PelA/Pel-15E family pectate lyase
VTHFFNLILMKAFRYFCIAVLSLVIVPAATLVNATNVAIAGSGVDLTVAADGSGDVKSVQEAINKVPDNNPKRFVIAIKPGVYQEQVRIPANKPYISFIGESAENTILTFKLSNKDAGSTSAAYATYIGGHDFSAENITFENSFGAGSQAVAVLAEADRVVFKHCRFLGWQDTLYAKNGRQFYQDCYIAGQVDFIFGQAAAVFENCEIHSRGYGYLTAPMRFASDEPSGFVFNKCRLTAENTKTGVYLGRPWRDYGRTVFLNTEMGEHIRPEGWDHWQPEREKTAYFAEYRSSGKGANDTARVKWAHQLTSAEAAVFSTENFLKGKDGWDPKKADDKWLEKTAPDWALVLWRDVFKQSALWYQTDEAARIADQVVLYQKESGGWEKNIDMALMLTSKEKQELAGKKSETSETTIDNRTTYTQVRYLAKVITASAAKATPPNNFEKHKIAFNKGLDFLIGMQYENGGFPQYFPPKKGYYTHITYNDDAMIGALELLRDISEKKADLLFVDDDRRQKAARAVEKGIEAILKTQVVVNGKKTVWCAQHDEVTLAPAPARKYEMISLSGYESVGIVEFLMDVKVPDKRVIDAVESAVAWFNSVELNGIKVMEKNGDRVVIKDKDAPPLWARFYEIGTNRPIFSGRDSIIKYSLAEIEAERRNGYRWYVSEPNKLLDTEYPQWKKRLGIK